MTDWPNDPYGDMAPILERSIEAAKARHPSGKGSVVDVIEPVHLTAQDRCDACGAQAMYRVKSAITLGELDMCGHHWNENASDLTFKGWVIIKWTLNR